VENYFNYFTEVEECYRRCRNTPTLLSTLDWALIESWKEAGIPLEAALLGIERAFEKFRARPRRIQRINSLAYCSQLVLSAAQEMSAAASDQNQHRAGQVQQREMAAPFAPEEIVNFLNRNAHALEQAARQAKDWEQPVLAEDLSSVSAALRETATGTASRAAPDVEELERHMTALEEKLAASLTRASSVDLLGQFHREVERGLAPYRRKMTAVQIESLERQFLKKRLFEHYHVPRLSLFYL
jgi:ribosome-binding protein aMBF1 (putative translation factor)